MHCWLRRKKPWGTEIAYPIQVKVKVVLGPLTPVYQPQDFPHLETHQRSHNPDCRVVIDVVVTFSHQDKVLLLPHVQDPHQVCICRPVPATHLAPLTGDDPVVDPR